MTFQADQPRAPYIAPSIPGLKANCLSYVEVLAQSVSVIAPSTVPAAVLGLIFAAAGNGTWLSFLIGMAGLVLVSYSINQFARRSASAGSLYSYIVKGLGSRAGVLGGSALLFGYTLTGMSTLCGFVLTVNALLGPLGLAVPSLLLSAIAVVRERSHLPIIVDPSHGTGLRRYVAPMAWAARAAQAIGAT